MKFDKSYDQAPAISLAIKNGKFAAYAYKENREDPNDPNNPKVKSFTIVLQQPATDDLEFAWTALNIKDAKTAEIALPPPQNP